jgi:hypothetical protein
MAITNPVAIRFCNEKARVAADLLAQLYNISTDMVAEWDALGGTSLIPNTSDVVRDSASPNDDVGTDGDGRKVITGAKVNNIINRLLEFRSTNAASGLAMGATGVLDTVYQVAVNTTPR